MNSIDNNSSQIEEHFLGSGWAFPVRFSAGNHKLEMSWYEKNVNDSINIILQTNMGERCMQPQFGSGLQPLFFKKMNENLRGQLIDAVKNALLQHEPRITVKDVKVTFADETNGMVQVDIYYIYNQTNTRHNYVYPFYVKEGTNL
ncbi:baseplate protein [Flavobacterium suaedae]|uniref:Baseplate protein n=1 Tax=Flavobacterium suaedae TaxID=1767027 RepID=A0ABQ1JWV9_9FLAO|nr:GPW/gp25 family protein [Flavobacterium suaedae]GGB79192.1 baseplate protein [Flavobacterium suaedae]